MRHFRCRTQDCQTWTSEHDHCQVKLKLDTDIRLSLQEIAGDDRSARPSKEGLGESPCDFFSSIENSKRSVGCIEATERRSIKIDRIEGSCVKAMHIGASREQQQFRCTTIQIGGRKRPCHAPSSPYRRAASVTISMSPDFRTSIGFLPPRRSSGWTRKFRIPQGLRVGSASRTAFRPDTTEPSRLNCTAG
jgi:hypothetical protein